MDYMSHGNKEGYPSTFWGVVTYLLKLSLPTILPQQPSLCATCQHVHAYSTTFMHECAIKHQEQSSIFGTIQISAYIHHFFRLSGDHSCITSCCWQLSLTPFNVAPSYIIHNAASKSRPNSYHCLNNIFSFAVSPSLYPFSSLYQWRAAFHLYLLLSSDIPCAIIHDACFDNSIKDVVSMPTL